GKWIADRKRRTHLRRQPDRRAADRKRSGASAGKARPRCTAVEGRHPDAGRGGQLARSRGYISVWLGLVAPKGTPKPIIEKVHAEVARVLSDPAFKEKSERTGNYPVTSTPDEFSAFIRGKALGE